LSTEAKQKLKDLRPQTLGGASRIQGINPSYLTILLKHIKKRERMAEIPRL